MIYRMDSHRTRMARRRPLLSRLLRAVRREVAAWRTWHATTTGSYPRAINRKGSRHE
ncbi:MAG: hypothetical protein IPO08_20050 [Xanthomonadales bacterium]|nr:hypothetical protein [Xanthomonadales bacterium]